MEFQINRLCVVCSDTASGIHYRVLTCEGCKGFWRRTIQRGMGPVYQCRQGAERCQVTPQSRGRCQRCRYLACVAAGMVADLVMSDRERIVKAKEVVNNRVKKDVPGRGTAAPVNSRDQEGQRLLTVAAALHQRFLATREVLGENQNIHKTIAAANNFLELFLAELMGGRYIPELMSSGHMEIVLIHLAVSRPASSLASLPLLAQLADHASELTYQEVVLAQAVAATRPRLSWPPPDRYKLGEIWDILAEAVRRWSGANRLPSLLQLVMQAAFACCYIPQETLIQCLQPQQVAAPGNRWIQQGWNQQQIQQKNMYPETRQGMYQEKAQGMYQQKPAGTYGQKMPGMYQEKAALAAGMYQQKASGIYSETAAGMNQEKQTAEMYQEKSAGIYQAKTTGMYPVRVGVAYPSPSESYVAPGANSPESIGVSEAGEHVQVSGVRIPQPPASLATIYKEVDYDVYGNNWHNGYKASAPYHQPDASYHQAVKQETQPELRPVPALHKIAAASSPGDPGQEDVIVPDLVDNDHSDFVAAEVSAEDLYEPASKKRKFDDLEEREPDNDVLGQALVGIF